MNIDLEYIKSRLNLRFKEFKPLERGLSNKTYKVNIASTQLSSPAIVRFVFLNLLDFSLIYREEKTHWEIPFTYKDHNCSISYGKFGLKLNFENASSNNIDREIIGKLRKSINYIETKVLEEYTKEQILNGNIIIQNKFFNLNDRYMYFRVNAELLFQESQSKNSDKENFKIENFFNQISKSKQKETEAIYNTISMIDSYYSRLEHLLLFILAFKSFNRTKDNISDFVGKKWSDKLKRVFDNKNEEYLSLYKELVSIKEKFRNTFAHGGFEKHGQSFYVTFGDFEPIPANLKGYKNSIYFNSVPIDFDAYKHIYKIFDAFDNWIKANGSPEGWIYAKSNLNMSFDKETILTINSFKSELELSEYLNHLLDLQDQYFNVDY